ncbi:MAG: Ribonuclease HII [Pelotomaculum sp. PtaB.Bin013]|uniref:Ribonuclease HII n=1 Tax=Pelotomaculum isophthalicicum JI TaxID=947010 RepID=A0A9X4GY41_9FIRM|nr:ribonuclease HII [Pelotomaculum isophthalicicum]MDF9407445.1 ribonuclease HII [Pelotomaculum isophthalicicum JI]OPX90310.1 MAG: Ribonuclease HII [Pelotomaculum sp. PtaB.Bin013]
MDISGLSVTEIKELVKSSAGASEEFIIALARDQRAGVREIYRKLKKAESAAIAEAQRLAKLFVYEDDLRANGYHPVAGVDEAGRGPLAGPVVAAAVILPDKVHLPDLNDSKKLTPQKRELLAGQIKETALAWAVGISTVEEIYRQNIHHAGLTAMRRAVLGLKVKPAYVLVDGFRIEKLVIPQMPIVGGDGLSASIAAGSILAKVERDHIMDSYHESYPEYGFNRHKGYATPEHLNALARLGPCPIHRAGFRPVMDSVLING